MLLEKSRFCKGPSYYIERKPKLMGEKTFAINKK